MSAWARELGVPKGRYRFWESPHPDTGKTSAPRGGAHELAKGFANVASVKARGLDPFALADWCYVREGAPPVGEAAPAVEPPTTPTTPPRGGVPRLAVLKGGDMKDHEDALVDMIKERLAEGGESALVLGRIADIIDVAARLKVLRKCGGPGSTVLLMRRLHYLGA